MPVEAFIDWVSHHVVESLLIAGTVYAILYVIYRRKSLFYRE